MTLEELKALLLQMENGADMVAVLDSLGGEINKKNNEAKNLRTRAKTTETDLAAVTEKLNKFTDVFGIDLEDETVDLDEALAALQEKIAAAAANNNGGQNGSQNPPGGNGGQSAAEIAQLMTQLKQLQRDVKKLTTEKETFAQTALQEKTKRLDMIRDSMLQHALTANNALEPELLAKVLSQNVKPVEDGSDQFVYVADDGSEVTIQEGVKSFLDAKPNLIVNNQRPGGGSAGGTNIAQTDVSKMSQEEYMKARQEGKIR